MTASFEEMVKVKNELESAAQSASETLQSFPRGAMGLTPDNVKATPEWKQAHNAYQLAADKVRGFNRRFIASYGKQWREYLHAKRFA